MISRAERKDDADCDFSNSRDAPVLTLLARLSRPQMRLTCDESGCFFIAAASGSRRGKPWNVDAETVAEARARGYLRSAPDGAPGDEILSDSGRALNRRRLMVEAAMTGDRRGATTSSAIRRGQRRSHDAAAARTPERRSVIEQLALRRDALGKPLLDPIQLAAGQRLARDFEIGQLRPRVTARWSAEPINIPRRRAVPGTGIELTEAASMARERMRKALADLGGELADVVFDVCCFEHTLQAVAGARHWSTASARLVLALALGRLAQHYGMVGPQATSGRIQAWGEGDFRPNADAWTARGKATGPITG